MNKKLLVLLLCVVAICLCSCSSFTKHLQNNSFNDGYGPNDDWDYYGKTTVKKLIKGLESNNKLFVKNLFFAKNVGKFDNEIDELFDYYQGTCTEINYQFSSETVREKDGIQNYFDECLAYVYTKTDIYTLEFVLCKNNNKDKNGIIALIVSTEELRKTDEYTVFFNKIFDLAEDFNKEGMGVFIYSKQKTG